MSTPTDWESTARYFMSQGCTSFDRERFDSLCREYFVNAGSPETDILWDRLLPFFQLEVKQKAERLKAISETIRADTDYFIVSFKDDLRLVRLGYYYDSDEEDCEDGIVRRWRFAVYESESLPCPLDVFSDRLAGNMAYLDTFSDEEVVRDWGNNFSVAKPLDPLSVTEGAPSGVYYDCTGFFKAVDRGEYPLARSGQGVQ